MTRAVHQLVNLPAPIGGLNYRDPISAQPPLDAVVLDNMLVRPSGLELRPGWMYITQPLVDAAFPLERVATVASFVGLGATDAKLFAFVGGLVFDTGNPADPGTPLAGAVDGRWQTLNFVTEARHYLVAVNRNAGYWTYDSTGGWVKRVPTGAWPATDDIVSVCVWKNALWFCFGDTSNAYYLEPGLIAGDAILKTFGPQFQHGGTIAGMTNWTLDAGIGIDDHQVVFSTEGDVVIYSGTDPADPATYSLKGIWYVGKVPRGGRFFSNIGGDVIILSEFGLTTLSLLVEGISNIERDDKSLAAKIRTRLAPVITASLDVQAWQVFVAASINSIILKAPVVEDGSTSVHYVQDLTSRGWGTMTGVPAIHFAMHLGKVYMSVPGSRVVRAFDNETDAFDSFVDPPTDRIVEANVQCTFNAFGDAGALKLFLNARPVFIAATAPSVKVQMNTEYTFRGPPGSPAYVDSALPIWDLSKWDQVSWGGDINTYAQWIGLTGVGYFGALRLAVRNRKKTTWASSHVMYQPGGVM